MKVPKYLDFLKSKDPKIKFIKNFCKKYNIKNYTINSDLSIDVEGDVIVSNREIYRKLPIKFNYVKDDFICANNLLSILEGCPKIVGGSFNCDHNKLNSLEYCPEEIGGYFLFEYNQISSVEFFPKSIGAAFYYTGNPIFEILINFPQNLKIIEYLNDYDVIQDNIIVKDRLEALINDLNLKINIETQFANLKYYKLE